MKFETEIACGADPLAKHLWKVQTEPLEVNDEFSPFVTATKRTFLRITRLQAICERFALCWDAISTGDLLKLLFLWGAFKDSLRGVETETIDMNG